MVEKKVNGKYLGVAGAQRHVFYKCAPGPSSRVASKNEADKLSDSSSLPQKSSSFTQTDTRESEVQTEPFWNSSGNLKLLCFRGSHRKLHQALILARYADFDNNDPVCEETCASMYRSIGCGPSNNEPRNRADPTEAWVSSFQKIQVVNEKLTMRITQQQSKILKDQERKMNTLKRTNKPADLLSKISL